MTLKLFSGAWGKMIHEKNPEEKNLVTLSLQVNVDLQVASPSDLACSVMLFSIELRTSLKYHKSHARLIPICFTHCQFGEERVLKGGIF
jgi:hypothetical protein